jgi:transcriptional regulator with XRE-family HTH domain
VALTVGQAIKNIRTRLRMTQAEFAEMLGSQRNSIRRYEAGLIRPGFGMLGKLFGIALAEEKAEKEAIVQEWNAKVGSPQIHVPGTPGTAHLPTKAEQIWDDREFFIHLREVFNAAAWRTLTTLTTADDSLREIFDLWSRNKHDERAIRMFREAAASLRDRLATLAPKKGRQGMDKPKAGAAPKRARYRVIMPVTFGDGVMHGHGEIVELDLETALEYAHALHTAEEEPAQAESKKLA